jgi:hypothetical protein
LAENNEDHNLTNENKAAAQVANQEKKDAGSTLSAIKDAPKTSADIENGKKQFNSGNTAVNGNQAENLVTIQNAVINGGISFGGYTVREVLHTSGKVDKEYDLSDAEQFAEFGETVRAGEYFAVAVILCVFEYVELSDLQDLKTKLLAELPRVTDAEGTEIAVYQNDYLSTNRLLKTVQGEMVVLESGEHCVRLGANRPAALKNLWQQFPEMRGHIARWLLNVCDSFEYRTNFDTAQITNAFVNILKLDFTAGINHFFPRFYSNPDRYWMLGFIALELYNDQAYRDKILPYINKWADSSGSWLWKSAVYVYANIKNGEESDELEQKVRKALATRYSLLEYDDLRNENLPYVGMLLVGSERMRTLVASIFGDLVNDTHSYDKKRLNCLWYLELLRYGYYLVSSEMTALPLVACDKKQQMEDLLPLLEFAMLRYDTRQLLFITLESYIREISGYSVEKKTINRIKAFFQLIAESNPRFRDDVGLFLKKCDCGLAKELGEFLDEVLPSAISVNLSIPGSNATKAIGVHTDKAIHPDSGSSSGTAAGFVTAE